MSEDCVNVERAFGVIAKRSGEGKAWWNGGDGRAADIEMDGRRVGRGWYDGFNGR